MSSVTPASDTDEGSTTAQFSVRIAVRTYELDALGHLNQAVYHSYAEHSRVEMFRAAGCDTSATFADGFAPVLLASEARYLRELRGGEEVDLSTAVVFGAGKTFAMNTRITKLDGTVSATVNGTLGLLDMTIRRLVANPRERIAALATNPAVIFGPAPA
ncbi:MAG TPA: acyl-CoA thioesterase [Pseudonocardiaceae bacterium]|jgi:acyl-CoA thioester hydrolase|nr:acyl-CoA thioesterase [Pseudonocardiaceae bacterium]